MINILGSEWRIEKRKREEDPRLNAAVGYTDTSIKTIVVEEMEADADSKSDLEAYTKQVVRHEIIPAFLHESGLDACASVYDGSWAMNEEMVDWISIQAPKLLKAFKDAGVE